MTYRTTVSDPFLRLVSFAIVSFLGMVLVFSLVGLYNTWIVFFLYVATMVGFSYFLMKALSEAMVETELLNDRIRLKWIRHNVLSKYPDEEILFADVKEDGFTTSRIARTYTLFLKNGREFSYRQFNWYTPRHEDLQSMALDIREFIAEYHQKNPEPWSPDGYKKTAGVPLTDSEKQKISFRLYFSVFAVVAIYLLIGFPLLKMVFPGNSLMWDFKMLAAFTGVLLLVSKVYGSVHEKMQKNDSEELAD